MDPRVVLLFNQLLDYEPGYLHNVPLPLPAGLLRREEPDSNGARPQQGVEVVQGRQAQAKVVRTHHQRASQGC